MSSNGKGVIIVENKTVVSEELRRVPAEELQSRLTKFRTVMDKEFPDWQIAIINNKINMYYFAGTAQDGVLVIRPQDAVLWVRRDYDRACDESLFVDIRPMKSFRELSEFYQPLADKAYLEVKTATLEWQKMLHKYLPFAAYESVNDVINEVRLLKSDYELSLMKKSGALHQFALCELAPQFIEGGVSEAELAVGVYAEMLKRGAQGTTRFNAPTAENAIGLASFGTSGLLKTAFDGPGGTKGTSVAVQSIGSAFRKLSAGELVYLDIPCGVDGYHTDKTVVYYYGNLEDDPNCQKIIAAYEHCVFLEQLTASLLKPGAVLEDIYNQVMEQVDQQYGEGFMNGRKFLGHCVGAVIDEWPAIAKGFKQKLDAGMVFAIEPKIALPDIGMVGSENTYLVTPDGAISLTGEAQPLRVIPKQ